MSKALSLLCCPSCGGDLQSTRENHLANDSAFDVLTCSCARFPVIAGIPVLKTDTQTSKLADLVSAGRTQDALLEALSPQSPTLAPNWAKRAQGFRGAGRVRGFLHQRALPGWRRKVIDLLRLPDGQVSACDWFEAFYGSVGVQDYYVYRFGQPRHLAALALMTLIQSPHKPVLDLACGCGHLTWSLLRHVTGQPVIGADQVFAQLYVAKRCIAPGAHFVCCEADRRLPFRDGTFAGLLCSDALQYLPKEKSLIQEFHRVCEQQGLLLFPGVRNALVRPDDGEPLTAAGYHDLFDAVPHRLVADSAILERYLQYLGPDLTVSASGSSLAAERDLTIVASRQEAVFVSHGTFEERLHAEDHLDINPLFTVHPGNMPSEVVLKREFPSEFYEINNKNAKKYLPREVKVEAVVFEDLAKQLRTPRVEGLISSFVVLGFPRQFLGKRSVVEEWSREHSIDSPLGAAESGA